MRGDLRIHSSHAPFRRAGLAWTDIRTPVEISIADLDGERLLRLVRDPAIRIECQPDDGGGWEPLPEIVAGTGAGQLQMMIDAIAKGLPDRPAPEAPFTVADALAERDLVSARLGAAEAKILEQEGIIAEQGRELVEATARAGESAGAVEALQARIAELERELAEAKARPGKTKTTEKATAVASKPAAGA